MFSTALLHVKGTQTISPLRRRSSSLSHYQKENIQSWIAGQVLPARQRLLFDHVSPSHLHALRLTLPTLDDSVPRPPHRLSVSAQGDILSPGHHLIFCNPLAPERELDADATIRLLSPPAPFVRRMWAGGKFEFKRPIRVGDCIRAQGLVSQIEAKRIDAENPMVLVEQTIETTIAGEAEPQAVSSDLDHGCITETRSHVYVPVTNERRIRTVKDLPKPSFSFPYTPTETTLFRFSALTFNAHRIHLDREYAQQVEKLPERLVHGPMTALMLLEVIEHNRPRDLGIATFEYRATNPLLVNRPITIHGSWLPQKKVKIWAVSDNGIVGMVGDAVLR